MACQGRRSLFSGMEHLDIAVGDLDASVAWATDAGAALADYQPQDDVRVLLDPAGHPFCLFLYPPLASSAAGLARRPLTGACPVPALRAHAGGQPRAELDVTPPPFRWSWMSRWFPSMGADDAAAAFRREAMAHRRHP